MTKKAETGKKRGKKRTEPTVPDSTAPFEHSDVVVQPGSGRRFLLGCALPSLLLLFLIFLAALPAVWCILQAKAPDRIPRMLDSAVNRLRLLSSRFYHLTEKGCALAGGAKRDLLERAGDHPDFRLTSTGPDGTMTEWIVHSDFAERILPGQLPEIIYFSDRTTFLHSLRSDGEFSDSLPFPARITCRAGYRVRIRACPAEENGTWLFDCRYACGRSEGGGKFHPYAGRHLPETGKKMPRDLHTVLYLAGQPVEERIFPSSCYLRGEEALSSVPPAERMFHLYAFGPSGERLRAAVISGNRGEIADLIRRKNSIVLHDGTPMFPESLIRMAVRRSDLPLVSLLTRNEDALQEMTDESAKKNLTALHEAAMQPNPQVLAKIIPLYSETNIREPISGATPLLIAVMMGYEENVLLFLRRSDRDLRAVLRDGSGALHLAVEVLSPRIVEMLLDHGADKSSRDGRGDTPLSLLKKKIRAEHLENDRDAERIRFLLEE